MSIKILVETADDLRDALPTSGLFEMTDCTALIDCPLDSSASEVRKMVAILEGAIHLTDVVVVGNVAHSGPEYLIELTEVSVDAAEGRKRRPRK